MVAFSFLTIVRKLKFSELTKFTCYPTPFPKLSKIDNLIVRQRPLRSHLPKRMLACWYSAWNDRLIQSNSNNILGSIIQKVFLSQNFSFSTYIIIFNLLLLYFFAICFEFKLFFVILNCNLIIFSPLVVFYKEFSWIWLAYVAVGWWYAKMCFWRSLGSINLLNGSLGSVNFIKWALIQFFRV